MARTHLSEKVWYDPEVKSYVMLDVTEHIDKQSPLVIDGVELLPKDEYHVTLAAVGKVAESPEQVADVIASIAEYLEGGTVAFDRLGSERYVCRNGDETTLIAPAVIDDLEGLRHVVQQRIPSYEPAFPHVTLLKSASSPYGIGVNSIEDFHSLCRPVEVKGE